MNEFEIEQETIQLTPEQLAAVKLADAAYESGESLTSEEVRELARRRSADKLSVPQH